MTASGKAAGEDAARRQKGIDSFEVRMAALEKTYNATVATKGRQIKGLRGRWLLQDTEDKDTGFSVSLWESAGEMQAYEQGELYKKEIAPALQPFFVGDYKTYRCDVKYTQ